jgi:CRP-like cAMP-binding protein
MAAAQPTPESPRNRLLAALPLEEYERLQPQLETVSLALQERVYEQGEPVQYVYFPRTGVISLLAVMPDGAAVEFATVGSEGMVGLPVLLGAESLPSLALCQVPSVGERISAADFREAISRPGRLPVLLHRYTQALFNEAAQSAVCNRLHTVDARCARWLLITHDRVEGDRFPITQEFLSFMLGVRRPSVSMAAGALQKAGLIHYTRGQLTVLDRPGLEVAACDCYRIVCAEFERLLGPQNRPE